MKKFYFILSLLYLAGPMSINSLPQEKEVVEGKDARSLKDSYHTTLDEIGNGLSSGKIASISNLFSSQIYLNLSSGVSGYYSSNQAYYVIQEFLTNSPGYIIKYK